MDAYHMRVLFDHPIDLALAASSCVEAGESSKAANSFVNTLQLSAIRIAWPGSSKTVIKVILNGKLHVWTLETAIQSR